MKKKEFYAYLAGFFDGEGSVCILKYLNKNYKNVNPTYMLSVRWANTNLEVLNFIKDRIGGWLTEMKDKRAKGKNWKRFYRIEMNSGRAKKVLNKMLPYLIIKREHAKLGIKLQQDLERSRPYRRLTQKTMNKRERIRQELKKLNQKGLWAAAETERRDLFGGSDSPV